MKPPQIEINNFSKTREERAKEILKMGNPVIIDKNTYLVPSQSDNSKKYEVTYFDFILDNSRHLTAKKISIKTP